MLAASVAFAADKPALCEFAKPSIVSVSSSGLAQVSNLGNIEITCRVSGRPFPTRPGENRRALKIVTTAFELLPDGSKKAVPSEAHETGGGSDYVMEVDWVTFYVEIPLESAERDEEARRLFDKMEEVRPLQLSDEARQQALKKIAELMIAQHRVGHFQLECRVMDGERVAGFGNVEMEVLFKGRISDVAFAESPTAQK
jgi:hypothetical protein